MAFKLGNENFIKMYSRPLQNLEFGHFTLTLYRGRQRSVMKNECVKQFFLLIIPNVLWCSPSRCLICKESAPTGAPVGILLKIIAGYNYKNSAIL